MTNDIPAVGSSRLHPDSLDTTDRILLGAAAALWLTALGAGVAAVVALSNLGGADSGSGGDSETPWLLYAVIAVSAVVIVAAVPLLIRARRAALEGQPGDAPTPDAARTGRTGVAFGDPVATTNLRAPGAPTIRRQSMPPPASSRVGFPTAAVERIFLRCPAGIAAAMGAAATLIGTATYLTATGHETPAWVAYGVAGLIIVAMPAIPVFFLRRLRSVLA